MDLVFSTDQLRAGQALCRVARRHLRRLRPCRRQGDATRRTIAASSARRKFGEVVLTDILLSEQRIRRNSQHISQLDKDCYYLQLVHTRQHQRRSSAARRTSRTRRAARSSRATEQYELHGHGRSALVLSRDPARRVRAALPARADSGVGDDQHARRGLGRIATEFCATLATEGSKLEDGARAHLGGQLMDMLAFTLLSAEGDMPAAEGSVQQARLRSVQQWIEAPSGRSRPLAREDRRRQRHVAALPARPLRGMRDVGVGMDLEPPAAARYDDIAKGDGRSITSIAFDHGFNSSAHFSTLFRRKYGISPRDLSRTPQLSTSLSEGQP